MASVSVEREMVPEPADCSLSAAPLITSVTVLDDLVIETPSSNKLASLAVCVVSKETPDEPPEKGV